MRKNKVLFITNIPSPYRVRFFSELGKQCDLTVVFEGKTATDRDANWKADKQMNFEEVFLKGIRTGSDNFFSPGILKYLHRSWDHIIIAGYSTPTQMIAIEYLRIRKIPFIIEVDGGVIRQDKPLLLKIKRHFLSSADLWMSSSPATTDYLVHYGADREKCFLFPFTSISESDIRSAQELVQRREEMKHKLSMTDAHIVLSVGQFIPRKGFDVLLNAIPKIQSAAEYYIIGGIPTEEYKRIVELHEINNVHFVPFMNKAELSEYFACADVFVLPTREDIWGLVVNEAMAFGLPVITTDKCVGGVQLFCENGFIVRSDSAEELADAIEKVLSDSEMRSRMRMNSLEKIREFTIEKMAEAHMNVFHVLDAERLQGSD